MSEKRKDNKGRILRNGETQRSDGMYMYRFNDAGGVRRTIYSWRLVETDKVPPRKKSCEPLRELEKQLERDTDDGIQSFIAAKKTVNDFYEKYREHNIYICTTKGKKFYTESIFKEGDCFLFGKESQGLPEEIMDIIKDENKIRIPMINTTTRSLNVANTANIVLYEALRQVGFPNMK